MNRFFLVLGTLLLAAPLAAQPLTIGAVEQVQLPAEDVTFVENRGQWPDEVEFLARLRDVDVWVTATGFVYDVHEPGLGTAGGPPEARRGRAVRVRFVEGRAERVEGVRPWPTYHNYFLGSDSAAWASRVPVYEEVVLHNVHEGVSIRMFEADGALKHELVHASESTRGDQYVEVEGLEDSGGSLAEVFSRAASLGAADPGLDRPALPGPPARGEAQAARGGRLLFARFLGGGSRETVRALSTDGAGSVYLGGQTESGNFPTPNGYDTARQGPNDAYLAQLSPDGSQPYGTFVGGNRREEVRGVRHANGSVYITGVTQSPNFPTTPGAYERSGSGPGQEDAFVMRLRTDGSGPVFSTFLGGGEDGDDAGGDDEGGDDVGNAIAVTANGAVVVGGRTYAEDFPAPNGSYEGGGDGFVVVLSGDGATLQGGTFLGGDELDEIRALELGEGAVYVAGETDSDDFGGLAGGFGGGTDAFVARLGASGNGVIGGTYLGGSGFEGATGTGEDDRTGTIALALDDDGAVYVSGDTSSDDFPSSVTLGALGGVDAFVVRLEPNATTVRGATVFGGSGADRARGVGVGPDGAILLAGETSSGDFPVPGADDASYNGAGDAFLVQLTNDGTGILYGTYLGGEGADGAYALVVRGDGTAYVAGETRSAGDFPVTPGFPPHQGDVDAFVAVYGAGSNAPPVVVAPLADVTLFLGDEPFSADLGPVFEDPDGDVLSYTCASSAPSVAQTSGCAGGALTVTPVGEGEATVTVTASDGSGSASDAFVITVTDNLPPVAVDPPDDVTLVLGEGPLVVDLSDVFDDPEEDPLDYACGSNDAGVASVSDCSGGTLTVTPEAEGEAVVTVTASDEYNPGVSLSFVATVVLDNAPPTVVEPIADATLDLGGAPLVVDLGDVFGDADGDGLSFDCQSSTPDVASVGGCADGTLVVTPASEGEAAVTVTATDPDGASAEDVFIVTVVNPPPVVVRPIPDFPLLLGGPPYEVDLDTVFADPNGDALAYSFGVDGVAVQLALDGSVLVVAPNVRGEATVTATASDGAGSTSEAFVVTVTDDLPPVVVEPPADTTLVLGGAPLILDIGDVFEDPEGDELTLSCSSGAPGVVSVGDCSGGTLTATPVSEGEALVTITASDGPNSVDTGFTIAVVGDNAPPFVVNPLQDVVLRLDGSPLVVELGEVFADADGDGLTYACQSSAPDVVAVGGCAGGTLVVTPETEGEATVRVTATDPDGAEAADEFVAAVVSNVPPIVRMPLPDVALVLGEAPLVIDLTVVFEDPEGEGLAFECESSDESVAAAGGCAGGTLSVAPVGAGEATVTVAATDPEGAEANDSFAVVVGCAPPSVLAVTPSPAEPERGDDVTVTALVAGGESATLRYRRGGEDAYTTEVMARDGDRFVAVIPGEVVTERGVEYAVGARNACGFPVQSDIFALRISLPAGVTSPVLPAATEGGGYRLVSVPLALEEAGADAVFSDFGSAGGDEWLLLQLMPPGAAGDRLAGGTLDQWYREDASAIAVSPGRAYWLIVRDGGRFNTGAGSTVSGDGPFSLDLHRGWNLVGSPFGHDVPLERVRTVSGSPVQLQTFDGAWRTETDSMRPFHGYALYVDAEDRLLIEAPAGAAGRSAPLARSPRDVEKGGEGWGVDIVAEMGSLRDANNTARVGPEAAEGRDASDWVEPPTVGDYVSVAFASPGGGAPPLTVDARPVPRDGATWPLRVRSNVPGRVTLSFDGVERVPSDYVVWLVDEHAGGVHDLRRAPTYSVASEGTGRPSRMQLLIGSPAYARAVSGFDGTLPSSYHLAPSYPNPFRTTTTIQFALPRNEHVVLEVFDVVGRRVARLVDEEVEAGYHSVVWDGRSTGAAALTSGVYVYRLRAGSFTATERAVLVR